MRSHRGSYPVRRASPGRDRSGPRCPSPRGGCTRRSAGNYLSALGSDWHCRHSAPGPPFVAVPGWPVVRRVGPRMPAGWFPVGRKSYPDGTVNPACAIAGSLPGRRSPQPVRWHRSDPGNSPRYARFRGRPWSARSGRSVGGPFRTFAASCPGPQSHPVAPSPPTQSRRAGGWLPLRCTGSLLPDRPLPD